MEIVAVGVGVFFGTGEVAGEDLIIGARLGIGRETGVSVGVGVLTGVSIGVGVTVVTGIGVDFGATIIFGVGLRRERGPGLIGRTASKYCVRTSSARVGVLVSVVDRVAAGDSLACAVAVALTDDDGVIDGSGLPFGGEAAVSLADRVGATAGVGEALLLFRGFGVGVGLTKSFLSLSPNVSSCSSVPRTMTVLIAIVIAITNTKRSFLFTLASGSSSQFLEHSLVHSDAGFEILQRKIFVR
jgi:hypothetical protein